MPVSRPYRRTCRPFVGNSYAEGGKSAYILDSRYADAPHHYIRAFELLLKDCQNLFSYVEPADDNQVCFSYRIHELLLRCCVEIEANFKAVLKANDYLRPGARERDWNMGSDYVLIEKSHRLSGYQVKFPFWRGRSATRTPFESWSRTESLPWYQAYNATKHDRHMKFSEATFKHLTDALCGLLVVLSAQFYTHDFSPGLVLLGCEPIQDGMTSGLGQYFRVKFPDDWPLDQRYDFNWQELQNEEQPFQAFDYTSVQMPRKR